MSVSIVKKLVINLVNVSMYVEPRTQTNPLKKKLCFNYTGPGHRASDCCSNKKCADCKGKHHTSICEKNVKGSINYK